MEQYYYYSSSSSSSHRTCTDIKILGEYCPFIADVPINSYATPFPIGKPDKRSEDELSRTKSRIRKIMNNKSFDRPVPLADFCMVVKEKWENDDYDYTDYSVSMCHLV